MIRGAVGPRRLGRAGNILILVALAAVPLIGMVALAVDFGRTSMVKGKLDLAADEASLLATTTASNAYKVGDVNAVPEAIAAAKARFLAQTEYLTSDPSLANSTVVNVGLTRVGGLFNANVTYTAQTPTTFAWVVGITTLPISGQSGASLSLNPYVDIQILMDVSSSMTLATPDAMPAMAALANSFKATPGASVPDNVGESCTLACHWTSTGTDYYKLALQSNIQLRITVLQAAVGNLINTLAGLDTDSRFRLGLYSFNTQLNTVYALSPNVTAATNAVPGIAPDVNFCSNDQTCPETYFSKSMAQLTALALPAPQQSNMVPQRFLFIVGDGVYDQYVSGQRQMGAFDPADCAALKVQGVSILVLYTPYAAPVPTNGYYVQHIQPVSGQIEPNLQACASSPSYYFVANDATDINTQLQTMLQLVVQTSSHLIN
jgi:Flp pilus assembly protein TadG